MNPVQSFINDVAANQYNVNEYLDGPEMLDQRAPEKPVYTFETISKALRIAFDIILGILSVIFLPYGIYRLVHLLAGKIIVPAQLLKEPLAATFGFFDVERDELAQKIKNWNDLPDEKTKNNP